MSQFQFIFCVQECVYYCIFNPQPPPPLKKKNLVHQKKKSNYYYVRSRPVSNHFEGNSIIFNKSSNLSQIEWLNVNLAKSWSNSSSLLSDLGKLFQNINFDVKWLILMVSYIFYFIWPLRGCLVFKKQSLITSHSIFLTHHSSLKISQFLKSHTFGTYFKLLITQTFLLFMGPILEQLVRDCC